MTFQPRIVELTVGTSGAPGMTLGRYQPGTEVLHCYAKVDLTGSSKPNQCLAKAWNLSPFAIKALELKDQVLIVRAGEGIPGQIFAGDIPKGGVRTMRAGADRVTEIRAKVGGRKWRDATFSQSYPAGMSRAVALADAFRALGMAIGFIGPSFTDLTFPGPWAFMGKARDAADELVGMTLGAWWVQLGTLAYIVGPLDMLPGNAPVISATTGLHGSPKRSTKGIEFTSRFNAALTPGGPAALQTFDVTGAFKVRAVTHEVDNREGTWKTKVKTDPKAI